jgi:hypothetical protein
MAKVIVVVDGGVVTGAFSDDEKTEVVILDIDNKNATPAEDTSAHEHFDSLMQQIESYHEVY